MIRKALAGASFALGSVSASSRRVINFRPRLASNLTVNEKDNVFSSPVTSPEETHKRLLMEMETIVNKPEIDLISCMEFLRKSAYFYQPNYRCTYLKDFHSDLSFELLCDSLCNTSERMSYSVATYILVRLSKLEISSINPLIVMRYWQRHIDPNIKFLKYIQIEMLLVHVLERMVNTSWTESKKNLLVRRLRTKILTEELQKLSTSSIISAINLMHAFGIVDIRVSDTFIKSLMNQNPPDWLQIFRVLGTLDCLLPGYEPILKQARKHVFEHIMDLPLWNLIEILRCIKNKVWQGRLEFYDARFVDAIVDRALWDDCTFEVGYTIFAVISGINHKHIPLLEFLIKKYEDMENKNLQQLLILFSYAVKVNAEATARLLLEKLMREEKTIKSCRKMLTYLTYYMSVLDYYDLGLLQALFSNVGFVSDKQLYKLKRLISTLKIFCPSCPVPHIPKNKLQKEGKENIEERDPEVGEADLEEFSEEKIKVFPLKSKLELIFGGPEYLLTNVKLGYRVPVDHAVIFRQGGFPVAINLNANSSDNNKVSLNGLSIPPNSHIVLITSVPSIGYILNTGEMTGPYRLYVKCLKVLKYDTILVNEIEWNKLPDSEKIPWLMRVIRENCKHVFEGQGVV